MNTFESSAMASTATVREGGLGRIRSFGLRAGAGVLVLASLAIGGGQAFAATPVSSTGTVGKATFTDSAAKPGVDCVYQGAMGTSTIYQMSVNAPKVFWPTSAGSKRGTVGYAVRVQRHTGSGWVRVYQSPFRSAAATTTTAAKLPDVWVRWGGPSSKQYRAQVILQWVTPAGTTIGTSRTLLQNYRIGVSGPVKSFCPSTIVDG